MKHWTRRGFASAATATLAATRLACRSARREASAYTSDRRRRGMAKVSTWASGTRPRGHSLISASPSPPTRRSFQVAGESHGMRFLFSGHQPQPTLAALSSFRRRSIRRSQSHQHRHCGGSCREHDPNRARPHPAVSCLRKLSQRQGLLLQGWPGWPPLLLVFEFQLSGHVQCPASDHRARAFPGDSARQSFRARKRPRLRPHHGLQAQRLYCGTHSERPSVLRRCARLSAHAILPSTPTASGLTASTNLTPRVTFLHLGFKWCSLHGCQHLYLATRRRRCQESCRRGHHRQGWTLSLRLQPRSAAEELLVYAIDSTGRLTLAGRTPLGGKEARHFALAPDGNFLVVAEQFTNQVGVFTRDRSTGLLVPTGNKYPVNKPSCIVFV